jgi:hypothetical protein
VVDCGQAVQAGADDLAVAPFPLPAARWLGRFAGPELRWAAWQQAIGSSYVFFAALVLLLSACGQLIPRRPAARAAPHPGYLVTSNTVNPG